MDLDENLVFVTIFFKVNNILPLGSTTKETLSLSVAGVGFSV